MKLTFLTAGWVLLSPVLWLAGAWPVVASLLPVAAYVLLLRWAILKWRIV